MLLKLGIILKHKTGNLAVWLLDYLDIVEESLRGGKKEKKRRKKRHIWGVWGADLDKVS